MSASFLTRGTHVRPPIGLILLAASCGGSDPAPPPSVILISLDTLRAGHMSLYGYERETTPYLDKLAAEECLVFDQAHTVSPWTLISHATMLTGLYPEQHGVLDKVFAVSPEVPLLAQRLREQGFQTAALFKPGFIGRRYGEDRGFDVFLEHEQAPQAGAHLDEVLPQLDPEAPFFLFLHLFDIHSDALRNAKSRYYNPPPPYDKWFMPEARSVVRDVDYRPAAAGAETLTEEQLEATVSLYDGNIRYVDAVLEEWIEGWRRDGLLDNTLVIITADHGEALGQRERRIYGHGRMFEDGLHIPLIVRFPDGYRAGEREAVLVSLVDIVPTVMEATGIPPDERLPGYSLRGDIDPARVVGATKKSMVARIRLPWKLVRDQDGTFVFNLEEDPLELNPVEDASVFEQISKELSEGFLKELDSRPQFDAPAIPAIEEESEEMRRELEALGYAGDDEDEDVPPPKRDRRKQ